jgi:hypothetical protein
MTFEAGKGWVGNIPTETGVFIVTVRVSTSDSPVLMKQYPLIVAPTGVVLPPHSAVDTSFSPTNGGTVPIPLGIAPLHVAEGAQS